MDIPRESGLEIKQRVIHFILGTKAALADYVMFVNRIITSSVYKQGDSVCGCVCVYRLCVPRSFHRKYVDNSFYS